MHITREELLKTLTYDSLTGELHWIVSRGGVNKTKPAGSIDNEGYRRITINGKKYGAHRLVYLYHNELLPKSLDHINRVKHDNRVENLRPCNDSQNQANVSSLLPSNTSGYRGVSFDKERGKWVARIRFVDNEGIRRRKKIGRFVTKEEAALAYNRESIERFGEFAVINDIIKLPN